MEIILKEDVENVGFALEVVDVKPGYGRNYLIPQGLAELATDIARAQLEKTLEARAAEEKALIDAANEKLDALNKVELKITAKAGEGDKLFGSINNADLVKSLSGKGIQLEKKNIKIPGSTIKRVGTYTAKIRLHREVESDFEFEVVAEKKA